MQIEDIEKMREASGSIKESSKLVAFIYELVRDHLPLGVVEELINNQKEISEENQAVYTNGWLAQYARYCAQRL
jgi:hypothetical protein